MKTNPWPILALLAAAVALFRVTVGWPALNAILLVLVIGWLAKPRPLK